MKKKFYWKEYIKTVSIGRFIKFIIVVLLTTIAACNLINEIGFLIVIESVGISILYDEIKLFIKEIKEINNKFSIEK